MTSFTAELLEKFRAGDVTAANVDSHLQRAGGADSVIIEVLAEMMPTRVFAAVTPHDTNRLTTPARALYIGGDGDVTAVNDAGTSVAFVGLKAGTILPIATRHVKATGTTATSIVAL